jgi:hypothetical protein
MPVETPDGVRAGCGAIPATDAPGIDDAHNSFFIGIGCAHGADLDTGRMLAMHAGSWKEPRFNMGIFAFDIRKKFNPVDGAAQGRFLRSDDGDIVLRMASRHTGLAPGASIQIDDHPPLVHCSNPKFKFQSSNAKGISNDSMSKRFCFFNFVI